MQILKTMAVSRIMLDNVANLKAYWVTSTVNLALVAQESRGKIHLYLSCFFLEDMWIDRFESGCNPETCS